MLFCTYCGKSFTRKEHLERHIPRHTNVMPYRCGLCQLSFPRRDLAQRHHSAYHETKDSMLASPCDVPAIACIHCASAKTRCDKRVPCSRCAEKDLQCEARFARRRRAQRPPVRSPSSMQDASPLNGNSLVSIVPQEPRAESATIQPNTPQPQPPHRPDLTQRKTFPLPNLITAGHAFESPNSSGRELDAMMTLDSDLLDGEYQDLMMWNQYSLFPDTDEMQAGSGMHPSMELNGSSLASESLSLGYSMSTPSVAGSNLRNGSLETVPSLSPSHTRTASMASHLDFDQQFDMVDVAVASIQDVMTPEREIAIAAEAAWPLARCNPPIFSGSCPRTAVMHLEALEEHSKHETWARLAQNIAAAETDFNGQISVVPLNGSTRDTILAITQSFLHRALETHSGRMKGWDKTTTAEGGFNFLVLPPSNVLEYFLRGALRNLGLYYGLIPTATLDPNHLMPNTQRSTLLLLLMIAHGAIAEARVLTSGLIEACRISLFHVIEKDVELSADPTILRCALLFIIVGAWSGDAWHMNIAMGQRAMYLAMLKHGGMLEPSPPMSLMSDSSSTELRWRAWQQQESKSRLVYNWVMVDQELSLFHDTAPILSITELGAPMPGSDFLWYAKDPIEWLAALQTAAGTNWTSPTSLPTPPVQPSLCDLFQDLLNESRRYGQLSPFELRLLLHPIQSLLFHLRQVSSCFSDLFSSRRGSRTLTKTSTLLRLEEIQSLLQKWYELSTSNLNTKPNCLITQANLVLYHLISLNAITSFPETERLARRDAFDGSSRDLHARYKRCIHQPEEAVFHAGQIIRLLCGMPKAGQPYWWSAALYRATMILWVESLFRLDQDTLAGFETSSRGGGEVFPVNMVMEDDALVSAWLGNGEGIPVLRHGEREFKLLPEEVLGFGVRVIGEGGQSLRVSEGMARKLQMLAANWGMKVL
ncbi:hypothetical protein V8E51_013614 [Hyaloscypha variabilis]